VRRAGGKPGEEGFADPGKPAGFEYVVVSPEGKEVPSGGLRADLFEDRWNTVLRKTASGGWRYETTRDPVLIASQAVSGGGAGKSRGSFEFIPKRYGSYRVVLTDPDSQASAAVEFYAAGWGTSPWAIKNPSRLELDLDKTEYAAGDTATVQVRAPFPGKLLITVERDVESLKQLVLDATQASDQAKAAVQQNSRLLQEKLSERSKLMSQLDQAKMQEEMNKAMSSLQETVGADVPTFSEVEQKIQARYAKAKATSELNETSVESRVLEIEQATANVEAQSRLSQLRAELGLDAAAPAATSAPAIDAPAAAGEPGTA
jgi:hypothetical protein